MECYLDNSATTQVHEDVKNLVVKLLVEDFGNPSAMHLKGMEAENYIKRAATQIAKTLKVTEKEILFTSGGTESNNLAIIGTAMANKRSGMHIITTSIEHPSVSATMEYLEKQGFKISYLPVDENGHVSIHDIKKAICDETILVSIMHVNNEMGAIEPVEEIGKAIKEIKPDIIFHVDDIQGFGKLNIYPKKCGIDLLSVSGHKIHGPKGTGFLFIKDKTKINPIIFGGGQQKGMRSGTENVPGIAGLGLAAEIAYTNLNDKMGKVYELKNHLIDGLTKLEDVTVNSGYGTESAPHIVSASFKGIRSEVLLHSLESYHIFVSAGSACASNKPHVSTTLKAIGLKKELLDCTVRFSLCDDNTGEQIDYTLDVLKQIIDKLRLYKRK